MRSIHDFFHQEMRGKALLITFDKWLGKGFGLSDFRDQVNFSHDFCYCAKAIY